MDMPRLAPLLVTALIAVGCGRDHADNSSDPTAHVATLAHAAWRDAKAKRTNMDHGPCLGIISKDWVADVAGDPSEPADDEPANQCDDYRSGEAHHFVEVTPTGRPLNIDGKPYRG
jgi:hypothetical protein